MAPPPAPITPFGGTLATRDPTQDVAEVLAGLARLGFTGLKPEDLGKLNPVDDYEEEIQVMAEVRAYFKVAYKVCFGYHYSCLPGSHKSL